MTNELKMLESLLEGSRISVESRAVLMARFGERSFSVLKCLKAVDESPFSIEEWFAAWLALEDYLGRVQKKSEADVMMGYLQCCSVALSGLGAAPLFADHVNEMLSKHGFSGAHE